MIRCLRCHHAFERRTPASAHAARVARFLAYPTFFALGLLAASTAGLVIFFMPLVLVAAIGTFGVLSRLGGPPVHCPECGADNATAPERESAQEGGKVGRDFARAFEA